MLGNTQGIMGGSGYPLAGLAHYSRLNDQSSEQLFTLKLLLNNISSHSK